MPRTVLIEQFHVTVRVPATRPNPEVVAIRRTLSTFAFVTRLRRAVRYAVRADPALAAVRVSVSR
jgi:hypothetical protein